MSISEIATSTQLSDDEYLPIWSAMMETARGRRFLSEFARRTRSAETRTLLDSVQKLERALLGARERLPDGPQAAAPLTPAETDISGTSMDIVGEVLAQAVPALTAASRINARVVADLQGAADDIHAATGAIRDCFNRASGQPGGASQTAQTACDGIDARIMDINEILAVQQISDERVGLATARLAELIVAPPTQRIADSAPCPDLSSAGPAPRYNGVVDGVVSAAPVALAPHGETGLTQSPAVQKLIQEITARLLNGQDNHARG